jgi:signal transduction histidine kinase
VLVSLGREGDSLVASVADTGVGIPQAEQARLFERFFRSSATRDVPGTGLGLTIAHAIVDSHGGEIEFRSVPGEGTTFTFTLPQKAIAEDWTDERAVVTAR